VIAYTDGRVVCL